MEAEVAQEIMPEQAEVLGAEELLLAQHQLPLRELQAVRVALLEGARILQLLRVQGLEEERLRQRLLPGLFLRMVAQEVLLPRQQP
jgi:hypothetical protein